MPLVACWREMSDTPTTRFDLFTVRPRAIGGALMRMGLDRRTLRRQRDLQFAKLLGTGDGQTFDVRDADPRRWALLTVWSTPEAADRFARPDGPLAPWRRLAAEHWWSTLRTTRAKGSWSAQQPFDVATAARRGPQPGAPATAAQARPDPRTRQRPDPKTRKRHDGVGYDDDGGAVAVVTRARLRWSAAPTFWRAVPPVNADLASHDGLLLRIGIGEAPIGLQGTFSLWRSPAAMQAFAYRGAPHREVIARSVQERWYSEELFARFAVVEHGGTVFGGDPLGSA